MSETFAPSQTRQAKRIALTVSLQVTWLDSANSTNTEIMRTENVSKLGAFLITTRNLPAGTILKVESANRKMSASDEVLAKVVSVVPKKRLPGLGIKIIKGQDSWKQIITSL
jgi:hypothetical protein